MRSEMPSDVSSPEDAGASSIEPTHSSAPVERPTQTRRRKSRVPLVLIDLGPLTRQSIAAMFARALPEYVITTAASSEELPQICEPGTLCPALVVINTKSSAVTDPWVQTTLGVITQRLGGTPIVLLSDRDDTDDVMQALSYGIRGYLNPFVEPEVVFAALKLVHAGGTFIPEHAIRSASAKANPSSSSTQRQVMDLTPRELSVVELLREGKPNKLIAAALQMQESTVKVHVANIMKKLHATNRTHAATVANRLFSQFTTAAHGLPLS
jgi:DNA-binding NarL/FixJ family response regulator